MRIVSECDKIQRNLTRVEDLVVNNHVNINRLATKTKEETDNINNDINYLSQNIAQNSSNISNLQDRLEIFEQSTEESFKNNYKELNDKITENDNDISLLFDNDSKADQRLTAVENTLQYKADKIHTHTISDINNLQTSLNGKANKSHTHNSSDINFNSSISFENTSLEPRSITFQSGNDDNGRILFGSTGPDAGYLEIATGDNANEPIYVRQYQINGSKPFDTITREVKLLDENGNTSFPGNLSIGGNIVGNLSIDGDISGKNITGSGNINGNNLKISNEIVLCSTFHVYKGGGIWFKSYDSQPVYASVCDAYGNDTHTNKLCDIKGNAQFLKNVTADSFTAGTLITTPRITLHNRYDSTIGINNDNEKNRLNCNNLYIYTGTNSIVLGTNAVNNIRTGVQIQLNDNWGNAPGTTVLADSDGNANFPANVNVVGTLTASNLKADNETRLAAVESTLKDKADTKHTHTISEITDYKAYDDSVIKNILEIDDNGNAHAININNTSTSTTSYLQFGRFYFPNQIEGQNINFQFGKQASARKCGYFGYTYSNTAPYISFGFHSVNESLKIYTNKIETALPLTASNIRADNETRLASVESTLDNKADASHTHTVSEITDYVPYDDSALKASKADRVIEGTKTWIRTKDNLSMLFGPLASTLTFKGTVYGGVTATVQHWFEIEFMDNTLKVLNKKNTGGNFGQIPGGGYYSWQHKNYCEIKMLNGQPYLRFTSWAYHNDANRYWNVVGTGNSTLNNFVIVKSSELTDPEETTITIEETTADQDRITALETSMGDNETRLATVESALEDKADANHTHVINDITDLQTSLNSKTNNTEFNKINNTIRTYKIRNNHRTQTAGKPLVYIKLGYINNYQSPYSGFMAKFNLNCVASNNAENSVFETDEICIGHVMEGSVSSGNTKIGISSCYRKIGGEGRSLGIGLVDVNGDNSIYRVDLIISGYNGGWYRTVHNIIIDMDVNIRLYTNAECTTALDVVSYLGDFNVISNYSAYQSYAMAATIYSSIGHTHNSSDITFNSDIIFTDSGTNTREIRFIAGTNDGGRIAVGATETNSGWMEIATSDDATEPIYVRQYKGGGGNYYNSISREAKLLDASGNTSFPGTLTASNVKADNETRLATAESNITNLDNKKVDKTSIRTKPLERVDIFGKCVYKGSLNNNKYVVMTYDEVNHNFIISFPKPNSYNCEVYINDVLIGILSMNDATTSQGIFTVVDKFTFTFDIDEDNYENLFKFKNTTNNVSYEDSYEITKIKTYYWNNPANDLEKIPPIGFLIDWFYPVGSIYVSMNNRNPQYYFGGTWEQIIDRFLYCANSSKVTGGSKKITIQQLPSHSHEYAVASGRDGYPNGWDDSKWDGARNYWYGNRDISNNTNTSSVGGGEDYMPPYMTVYAWYRTA